MVKFAPPRRHHGGFVIPTLAAAALLTVTACGSDDSSNGGVADIDTDQVEEVVDSAVADVEQSSEDLAQTLRDNDLDSIAGVVEQIDVSEWLGDGDFTFFAPNNDAFMSLNAEQTADLLTDPSQIADVLRNHTLANTVTADELADMDQIETEAGSSLQVTADGDQVRLGADVVVVSTDIEVGNGVIHVVDGLLLP
jgi:uncharacterized surface protein with fasciclin (FAS1) repeats